MSRWFKRALIITALIVCLAVAYFIWLSAHFFGDDPFLTALLKGDDSLNAQYLSTDFQEYISQHCPDGKASGCIRQLVPPEWGELTGVKFSFGSPSSPTTGSVIYYSWWKNTDPIVIVLLTAEENGRQVYTGWRGFVPAEDENRDAELLRGQRRDNQFPPSFTGEG